MWPEAEKTEELINRARDGNSDAVEQLMDRHRDSLRQLIRMRLDRRIQTRVDVSDIVQDVLIEANRRLQTYLADPAMPFHLWVRHIARDRIIDAHRRHRGSARRSTDREQSFAAPAGSDQSSVFLARELKASGKSPATEAIEKELARAVETAIADLDEMDAEVIIMRHYEQLTNQEVARALDLTEPAAGMRYIRAIRRLRDLMQSRLK